MDSTLSLAVYVGQSREENAGLGLFVDTLVTSVGHHEAVVILKYLGLVVKWDGARPPPISGAYVLMGPQYYIDASSNDCAARYICEAFEREPNCWINVRAGEGIVTLAENITLQRGSELLTRYGWEYWALQLGALSNATFARCVSFYELYRPERLDLVPREFHERVLALRPDIEEIHTRVAPPTQPILVRGLPAFLRPADANPVIPQNLPRNSLRRSKTEPKKPDTASRSISSFFQPVRNSAASDAATPPLQDPSLAPAHSCPAPLPSTGADSAPASVGSEVADGAEETMQVAGSSSPPTAPSDPSLDPDGPLPPPQPPPTSTPLKASSLTGSLNRFLSPRTTPQIPLDYIEPSMRFPTVSPVSFLHQLSPAVLSQATVRTPRRLSTVPRQTLHPGPWLWEHPEEVTVWGIPIQDWLPRRQPGGNSYPQLPPLTPISIAPALPISTRPQRACAVPKPPVSTQLDETVLAYYRQHSGGRMDYAVRAARSMLNCRVILTLLPGQTMAADTIMAIGSGRHLDPEGVQTDDHNRLVCDPIHDGYILLDDHWDVGYLSANDQRLQEQHINFARYIRPALINYDPLMDEPRALCHWDTTPFGTPVIRLTSPISNTTQQPYSVELQATQNATHYCSLEDGNHTSDQPKVRPVKQSRRCGGPMGKKKDFYLPPEPKPQANSGTRLPAIAESMDATPPPELMFELTEIANEFGRDKNLLRVGSLNINGNWDQHALLESVQTYMQAHHIDVFAMLDTRIVNKIMEAKQLLYRTFPKDEYFIKIVPALSI